MIPFALSGSSGLVIPYQKSFSLEFFNKGSTIVIVTQSYHLYRAIYLAQRMGLNAYGVSADSDIVYRGQLYREFRDPHVQHTAECLDVPS